MARLGLGLGLGLALGLQLGIGIGFRRNHSWSSTFTPRRNHSLCQFGFGYGAETDLTYSFRLVSATAKVKYIGTISVSAETLLRNAKTVKLARTATLWLSGSSVTGRRRTRWRWYIDVGLVQRGYSIPSPVLLKCCVASVVA